MLPFYVFGLVLGGAFLLVSVLGDAFDGDVDADMDADLDHPAAKTLSLRTIVYTLFGLGAAGTAPTIFWEGARQGTTLLSSVGMGVAGEAIISGIFNYLRASDSGALFGEESFVGLSARVVLPLTGAAPGEIRALRGERYHRLRALPHGNGGRRNLHRDHGRHRNDAGSDHHRAPQPRRSDHG